MAWIRTVSDEAAADADPSGELASLYDAGRDPRTGKVDNILAIHGLHPAGLEAHFLLVNRIADGLGVALEEGP